MELKEFLHPDFGKCVSISNGTLKAAVTIDFGPRIIHLSLDDGPNILYQDVERVHRIDGEIFRRYFGEDKTYYQYGGHRLWISPEELPITYFPDNDSVTYSITDEGIRFVPPEQKSRGIQTSFSLLMNETSNELMIIHEAINKSSEPHTMSLWPITAMRAGGTVILPQNPVDLNRSRQPNRVLALWPYTDLADPRVHWGKEYITVRQIPNMDEHFKFGADALPGWAAYQWEDHLLVKHFVHNLQALYPDGGVSFECYVNAHCAEIETLSPLYRVEPKETIRHVEQLSLQKCSPLSPEDLEDEEKLARYMQHLGL